MRHSILYPWFTPVTRLKGVGPAVASALTRLLAQIGLRADDTLPMPTVRDLLFHVPVGVIDRTAITAVSALQKGQYATLEVVVTEHAPPPRVKRRLPYKVVTEDASGTLMLNFFHVKGDYLTRQLPVGGRCIISGTVDMYHGQPLMTHPDGMAPANKAAEVLVLAPSYPLTWGISQRVLTRLAQQALSSLTPIPEWHDAALLRERRWPSLVGALKAVHMPTQAADILPDSPARSRLAYDELLANQLALALSRRSQKRQATPKTLWNHAAHAALEAALPFTLTQGQQQVLADMQRDLASGERMVRLLQGDVGSGKTILAFAVMAQMATAGYQSCLMAPTDLLARQHFSSLAPLAKKLGLSIALLSGKMKKPEQEKVRAAIAAGEITLAVGTHALFQGMVDFQNLGLVVVDEQHRFGVGQRMRLTGKGTTPHLLQMSATPIPRSLYMTLYGDMDVSVLAERPPGRKEIDTRAIPDARMHEVIDGLQRVLAAGEKAYWVCPLIERSEEEEAEQLDLAAAQERFTLLEKHFPGKVGLMHGRMKLPEREAVMQAFAHGELQLLVATTVVEVGVDVPDATVMVIEHAERFGLAQMHQLRGRVGRSDKPSRCILLYHNRLSQQAKDRLKILRETNDGFRIAEEDLRLRGAGEMLGTRQTGLPGFLLADAEVHRLLIPMAHDDAKLILHRDEELLQPRGQALRLLLSLFEYDAAMAVLKTV